MTENQKIKIRIWHPQQEVILKIWGEQASCYRFMHNNAYINYKKLNARFSLPVIILSTVSGTANFAQGTFPLSWQNYVPLIIGAMNLFAAILSTVSQFLKVSEMMESHRVSSIQYGKVSRNIRLELTLPINERSVNGDMFIETCKAEYDRLIEQSPNIPEKIIASFKRDFPTPRDSSSFFKSKKKNTKYINRPEIIEVNVITPYISPSEQDLEPEIETPLAARTSTTTNYTSDTTPYTSDTEQSGRSREISKVFEKQLNITAVKSLVDKMEAREP